MNRLSASGIAGCLALCAAWTARAQLTNFATIDYPGSNRAQIYGINERGDMVGGYWDSSNQRHAFLLQAGKFSSYDFPGMRLTSAFAINDQGDIVGYCIDAGNVEHSFLLSGGRFTAIDPPGSGSGANRAVGINGKGEIVGVFVKGGATLGYLLSGGRFTEIQYPQATATAAYDITGQGEILGRWNDAAGKRYGFRLIEGRFTSFEFPGAQSTFADFGHISSTGDITGPYSDARGRTRSFLLSGGRYTSFDFPGSTSATAYDVNSSGQIVGAYSDAQGTHGFVTSIAPPARGQPILVDDDNAECPGALPTIQEAVRVARAETTILVCRGIYTGAVNITGPEKNGLKLIATGRTHEVILQGDYDARDGFHLENVSDVLIRGFTVRDFGSKATTATEWGSGNLIYLENAHRNTIEQNQLFNSDRAAIMLLNSSNNVIQQNVASADNNNLATCGIEVRGAQSANNLIQLNMTHGNKLSGIRLAETGPGNIVQNNTVLANGRYGIDLQDSSEVWVEGNRISYSRGYWGTTPGGQQPGLGINLTNLIKATIFDNRARGNSGADLNWDGKGENRLESNACETCTPASACQK